MQARQRVITAISFMLITLGYLQAMVPCMAVRPSTITTKTINPDRDAMVYASNTSANGGSVPTLRIGRSLSENYTVYVHFNLSINRTNLVSMELDTITSDPGDELDLFIWRVQDNWTELGVTLDTGPAAISHLATYEMPEETPDDGTDITQLANGTTPLAELSLCFNATTGDAVNYILINAREATAGSPGARIICTFDDGLAPPRDHTVFIVIGALAGIVVVFCILVDKITKPKKKTAPQPPLQAGPAQPAQAVTPYQHPAQAPVRFCTDCGTSFESDARFCSNCGKSRDE